MISLLDDRQGQKGANETPRGDKDEKDRKKGEVK